MLDRYNCRVYDFNYHNICDRDIILYTLYNAITERMRETGRSYNKDTIYKYYKFYLHKLEFMVDIDSLVSDINKIIFP